MNIEGEENFDPEILRKQGESFKEELGQIADWLTLLKKEGWTYQGMLYDVVCYKETTKEGAKDELKRIGIKLDPEELREMEE